MPRTRIRAATGTCLVAAAAALLVTVTAPSATAGQATALGGSSAAGTVFFPNPVQQTGNEGLTDNKDADYAALQPAYRRVTLTDLDGTGRLSGRYVTVKSATGKAAAAVGAAFPAYHRDADQFEQVMAYYWITSAANYVRTLGFGSTLAAVDNRQVQVRINQYGGDNSFFRDNKVNITFGKGGVDDAEDAEVIVHEYGHATQDSQVPGFGTSLEAGSIGEGFSDYFAVAVTDAIAGVPSRVPEACVADWDSTSYTSVVPHCLRRIDGTKHYPEDVMGEVHADGEIWSSALYAIRNSVGPRNADTLIIDAQFGFAPDTTFAAAARTTVATAQRLYGSTTAAAVRTAFVNRGLL
ncbi:MAG: M4 family metallopeptidase [Pseudonocardiales bacterium]